MKIEIDENTMIILLVAIGLIFAIVALLIDKF